MEDSKTFFSNGKPWTKHKTSFKKTNCYKTIKKTADKLNTFFKNAVSNLEINENPYIKNQVLDDILDPVGKCINKYQFHPSILFIKIGLRIKICFHSML